MCLSHGRDHKLRIWQCSEESFAGLSTTLPADGATTQQPQPWLLHALLVNALNFCAFDICPEQCNVSVLPERGHESLLLATPNGLDQGGIDVFQLPSERRVMQIGSDATENSCMVMALALFWHLGSHLLNLASGYEDGSVLLQHLVEGDGKTQRWQRLATCKPHSQLVLSLDISPDQTYLLTSSADAVIAKIQIPLYASVSNQAQTTVKILNTKHAGQQGLCIRPDGRIFATAGWDKRVRVYSTATLKELAVLKWHTAGCYATAFANTQINVDGSSHQENSGTAQNTVVRNALDIIKYDREVKAKKTHWLAVGSKDCKISLWDIY